LMLDVEVGVIGRPRVVHGDAAEPAAHTSIVDTSPTTLGVAGDQGVFAGAGRAR
jgi:hypothetical protein